MGKTRINKILMGIGLAAFLTVPTSVYASTEASQDSTNLQPPQVRALTPQETELITPENRMVSSQTTAPLAVSDPSGWQSRGKYGGSVYPYYDNKQAIPGGASVNWASAGGNFKVEFTDIIAGNSFTVQLMEYDPDNADDPVGNPVRIDSFNNILLAENISGFVDGSDNDAEFYVEVSNAYTQDYIYAEGFD